MARVSKIRLDYKTYTQILDTLDMVLGKMKKEEVRAFLFSLFGGNERTMVSKRFAAILLLNRGMKVTDIALTLKLTRQTIYRLARTQELKSKGFQHALKKVNQDKMNKSIKKILIGFANEMGSSYPKRSV